MILDHELSQLSNPQTSIVASLGFVGIGGLIGLFGPFLASVYRIVTPTPVPPLSLVDIWYVIGFGGSLVLSAVCLSISFVTWRANRNLADIIRARPKHGLKPGG